MTTEPIVLYVENDTLHGVENHYRSALCWILKKLCNCEVLLYQSFYHLEREAEKVQKLFDAGHVILSIVKQDYDSDSCIKMIRRQFSLHVPLVIIPDFGHRSEIEKYLTQSETYVFWYSDQTLVNLANRLVQAWNPGQIWQDSVEENKKAWLVKEQMLANAEYDHEVDLIRNMTDLERKKFVEVIEESFRPDRISCGPKVFGFAFDPITCESAMTNKDGLHRYAKDMLVNRLEII